MPERPEIDQKRSRDLKRPFKCGHSARDAYNFGYGLGDQEPFDFRDPFYGSRPTNEAGGKSVKNSEGREPLGTFCRIEIAARGFKRVSAPKITHEPVSCLGGYRARALLWLGACHISSAS